MTTKLREIDKLLIQGVDLSALSLSYVQKLTTVPKDKTDAEVVLRYIATLIKNEVTAADGNGLSSNELPNQVMLNMAFRSYFQLLLQHDLKDVHLNTLQEKELRSSNERDFRMLYAMLLSDHCEVGQPDVLKERCLQALTKAIMESSSCVLAILKALNLLCKKFPQLDMALSLDHIYLCLQNNQNGMREATLHLFSHICKNPQRAFAYFQVIAQVWPWTNRHKFFLLSCIFSLHRCDEFLQRAQLCSSNFFAGVRLSLSINYKGLLSASQYLIKSLSGQNSQDLLDLSVDILLHGSRKEIQNFHSQWLSRIQQKEKLFELLQEKPEIVFILENSNVLTDRNEQFRFIMIFSMFSRQIFSISKLHFFKISTELITNCFKYEIVSQELILKFIVDNFGSFAIEDCLDFILAFIKRHKDIDSSQFRNGILNVVPVIINHISKSFQRLHLAENTTLEVSIMAFFQALHSIIDANMRSELYQPKIFSLKLLEILFSSLYAEKVSKHTKNCCVVQNKQLGVFLMDHKAFDSVEMSAKLFRLISDPCGYDDALNLVVSLLRQFNQLNGAEVRQLCEEYCQRCDFDDCALSALYAKVTMQSYQDARAQQAAAVDMYNFAYGSLVRELEPFQSDPLLTSKTRNHIFGYINTINEVVNCNNGAGLEANFPVLLKLLEKILNMVLDMLQLTNRRMKETFVADTSASFQDMDISLELLVQESEYAGAQHEECRKFLLMSFWLTLRACCDLATSIACILAPRSESCENDLEILQQCLQINVDVLTRCRHKGAIEAAGLSIGKVAKCVTQLASNGKSYALLYKCLELLFDDGKQISASRRGAGLSLMLLHIVKNEQQQGRPLLKHAMDIILQRIQTTAVAKHETNYDRMEALTLHYLCVLVQDTELRSSMSIYYNDIIMAAIVHIDNQEWTVCNAALQTFGALIPKIVGQKPATAAEFDASPDWQSTEVTYSEILQKMPRACEYILNYCATNCAVGTSTRSIILFLSFLAKVDHFDCNGNSEDIIGGEFLHSFRLLTWRLLQHSCEKVRKLAAVCFVRAHEFHRELPGLLLVMSKQLFHLRSENFFQGLVFAFIEGILKIQLQSQYISDGSAYATFVQKLRQNLVDNFIKPKFKFYTLSKLLDLLLLIDINCQSRIVSELVKLEVVDNCLGSEEWNEKVALLAEQADKYICNTISEDT